MRFDTIIKNGTIVTATETTPADVGISDGKVAAVAASLSSENATNTIDASGYLLLPGGIDVHVSGANNGNVTIASSLTKTTAGHVVDISGHTGGAISLSGAISATGGVDNGISLTNNTAGTITFSNATTFSGVQPFPWYAASSRCFAMRKSFAFRQPRALP